MNIPFDPSTNTINFRTLPSGTLILCALSWGDDKTFQDEHLIIQNDDSGLYFCQNYFDGNECGDKHGQKYSWIIQENPMNIIDVHKKIIIQFGTERYYMNPKLQNYSKINITKYLYDAIIWSPVELDDNGIILTSILDSYYTL